MKHENGKPFSVRAVLRERNDDDPAYDAPGRLDANDLRMIRRRVAFERQRERIQREGVLHGIFCPVTGEAIDQRDQRGPVAIAGRRAS